MENGNGASIQLASRQGKVTALGFCQDLAGEVGLYRDHAINNEIRDNTFHCWHGASIKIWDSYNALTKNTFHNEDNCTSIQVGTPSFIERGLPFSVKGTLLKDNNFENPKVVANCSPVTIENTTVEYPLSEDDVLYYCPRARFYTEKNYGGDIFAFNYYDSFSELFGLGFDNRFLSVDIIDGAIVRVFEDEHFRGGWKTLSQTVGDLSRYTFFAEDALSDTGTPIGGNISSIRVNCLRNKIGDCFFPDGHSPHVCFWTEADFNGSSLCMEPGDGPISRLTFLDNTFSSVQVFAGVASTAEVRVYEGHDYQGGWQTITRSVARMSDHTFPQNGARMDNNISSIGLVQCTGTCPDGT
jgi:hypothetical protein